jgi:two-component system response regulator YesN
MPDTSSMYDLIIIDDETELLEGLSEYFPWESLGFRVAGAFGDCRTALQYCRSRRVDVVLTDIRLPFFSGFDLIRKLKNMEHVPLFCVMSAYSDFEYAKQAIQFGVQDYLVKPSSFEDIEKVFINIRRTLDANTGANIPRQAFCDNPLVNKAMEIIEKKTSSCTLNSIAEELDIHSSYLSRLFKEKIGENFQDYLVRKKMTLAAEMLVGKVGYRNNEIAAALGYQDAQNFCRIFRKHYGVSPQQYRQEHLK